MPGNPEDTYPLHEREDDLTDAFFYASLTNVLCEGLFKTFNIHVYHMLNKVVDDPFLLGECMI